MSLRKDHRWKSRKTISFIVSILLIAGTTTNIFFITNNGNIALAQAQSQSVSPDPSSSTPIIENNNTDRWHFSFSESDPKRITATTFTAKNPRVYPNCRRILP